MQREIIGRKRFTEAVRQFHSSTVGNGAVNSTELNMMILLKDGTSHGVEVYQANVKFQSVMERKFSYIYKYICLHTWVTMATCPYENS